MQSSESYTYRTSTPIEDLDYVKECKAIKYRQELARRERYIRAGYTRCKCVICSVKQPLSSTEILVVTEDVCDPFCLKCMRTYEERLKFLQTSKLIADTITNMTGFDVEVYDLQLFELVPLIRETKNQLNSHIALRMRHDDDDI